MCDPGGWRGAVLSIASFSGVGRVGLFGSNSDELPPNEMLRGSHHAVEGAQMLYAGDGNQRHFHGSYARRFEAKLADDLAR